MPKGERVVAAPIVWFKIRVRLNKTSKIKHLDISYSAIVFWEVGDI